MSKYILLVIFLFCNLYGKAQLLVRDGDCYVYGSEKICDSKSLEHILSTNTEALMWYHKSKSSKKKANRFGYSSLAGIVASTWLIQQKPNKNNSPDLSPYALEIGVLLVSCVLGTIGIINSLNHGFESKKAIDVFNGTSYGFKNPEKNVIISYGIVDHGIGVCLNF